MVNNEIKADLPNGGRSNQRGELRSIMALNNPVGIVT